MATRESSDPLVLQQVPGLRVSKTGLVVATVRLEANASYDNGNDAL